MRSKTKKAKKLPISLSNPTARAQTIAAQTPTVSRRVTQSTIARFHTLLKQQSRLRRKLRDEVGHDSEGKQRVQAELLAVESEMQELGGLHAYQLASMQGQSRERGGDSSKILMEWLNAIGLKESALQNRSRIRMLEIGALTPQNYAAYSEWIHNHPIDLNSQHSDIAQQDFFERPLPLNQNEAFDIVSCSLVLNFVSSPRDRGKMLQMIHQQLKPCSNSLLFLVLPLPCITNSRYLSAESLIELMGLVGFKLEQQRWRVGGKVGYWLWSWKTVDETDAQPQRLLRWRRKTIEAEGPKRNNFAIVLP
ncbi:hypothetical protein IAU59_000412 [Kwoniella sp. CBS 9459]